MSYPSKEERSACWGARDNYWSCLDKHNQKDSIKDGPCAELRKLYEKSCSRQWVKHFDRKRSYLQFKEQIEKEGYAKLDEKSPVTIVNSQLAQDEGFTRRLLLHE